MEKEKSYVVVPIWLATPFILAVVAYFGWLSTSILDLKANVAGLQVKVEILSARQHELAQHE